MIMGDEKTRIEQHTNEESPASLVALPAGLLCLAPKPIEFSLCTATESLWRRNFGPQW